jgi:hypothetical protein
MFTQISGMAGTFLEADDLIPVIGSVFGSFRLTLYFFLILKPNQVCYFEGGGIALDFQDWNGEWARGIGCLWRYDLCNLCFQIEALLTENSRKDEIGCYLVNFRCFILCRTSVSRSSHARQVCTHGFGGAVRAHEDFVSILSRMLYTHFYNRMNEAYFKWGSHVKACTKERLRERGLEGARGSLDQQETVYCDSASADGDHTNTVVLPAFEGVPGKLQACEYILQRWRLEERG